MKILKILFEAFCGLTPAEELALPENKKICEPIRNTTEIWLAEAFLPENSPVSRENILTTQKRSVN